jgi:hypothetical protein
MMLFTPIDPGVRDQGEFGTQVPYSPPTLPCRLFALFLEGFYNAVALTEATRAVDKKNASCILRVYRIMGY